jgi:hypothetical protein
MQLCLGLLLGLDPLNSLNNAIGANVLRGTELNQFTKAILAGNSDLAGELSGLAKVGFQAPQTTLSLHEADCSINLSLLER